MPAPMKISVWQYGKHLDTCVREVEERNRKPINLNGLWIYVYRFCWQWVQTDAHAAVVRPLHQLQGLTKFCNEPQKSKTMLSPQFWRVFLPKL